MNAQPIGIFDSGIGGLTVAKAIQQVLPNEQLIYYGDTAHLPYGDKSKQLVSHYAVGISEFLLAQGAKIIVMACNTASAAAFADVQRHVGNRAPVINVIDPVADFVAQQRNIQRLGVIGTKGTINSGSYERKIKEKKTDIPVVSMATPLFVPMIEEGFIYDNISNSIISAYLTVSPLENIDTLILGCTHYPLIKDQIRKFYNFNVHVVDSASIVARYLQAELKKRHLLANAPAGASHFYVSDYTETFKKIARMFFEQDIPLSQLDIWK